MVESVWGSANGYNITFKHDKGDVWKADVPFSTDGEYVLEMYARDTAGNVGYLATMLFIITGYTLQGFVVPRGYEAANKTIDYSGLPTLHDILSKISENDISSDLAIDEFSGETTERGYSSERIFCWRERDGLRRTDSL